MGIIYTIPHIPYHPCASGDEPWTNTRLHIPDAFKAGLLNFGEHLSIPKHCRGP